MLTRKVKRARIGLYSVGLRAYWAQFEGLEARLKGYNAFIASASAIWRRYSTSA